MDARNLSRLGFRFEDFIQALFKRHGFTVEPILGGRDLGHDLIVRSGATLAIVEVKLYSSMTPASRNIAQSLENLERGRLNTGAMFGILATNSRLSPSQGSQLDRFPNLRVYDFDVLSALAASDPDLALELEDINRGALVFRGEDLPTAQAVATAPLIAELGVADAVSSDVPDEVPVAPPQTGAQLCADIHRVGKTVAKPFEKACEAAVRYLFKDELVAFDDQHRSHTTHNIFDLVARIASKEDFWQALITDFRARYVVFEFKNYDKKITQREIYTTEKYLYPVAMRGAAIIVSRHGADAGADQAMRGALRESG
ncbi:MAG: hypothetical protein QOJ94_2707, partial [Sphingomonadales bacterium]|nr:hypothetical protein [Sphingomonadales bacterium]